MASHRSPSRYDDASPSSDANDNHNTRPPRRAPRCSSLPAPRSGGAATHPQRDHMAFSGPKFSLGFILHDAATSGPRDQAPETVPRDSLRPQVSTRAQLRPSPAHRPDDLSARTSSSSLASRSTPATALVTSTPRTRTRSRPRPDLVSVVSDSSVADDITATTTVRSTSTAKRKLTKASRTSEEKRLARKCTVDDCTNYNIDKGLCFRHGGGKKCLLDGCGASAKIAGLCWKHGGSIQCVVDGCDRRGKSRGFCWTHGGGTECRHDDCAKVAVSKGFCWAHGGGKRCQFDGCSRPAYTRTLDYCPKHFARFENGDEIMEV